MDDSYTFSFAMVLESNMLLGEIVFGGLGTGLSPAWSRLLLSLYFASYG